MLNTNEKPYDYILRMWIPGSPHTSSLPYQERSDADTAYKKSIDQLPPSWTVQLMHRYQGVLAERKGVPVEHRLPRAADVPLGEGLEAAGFNLAFDDGDIAIYTGAR